MGNNPGKLVKDLANKASDDIQNLDTSQYFYITLTIIIFILIILFAWIFDRLSLKDRYCSKLDIFYPTLVNSSYLNNDNTIKNEARNIFDISNSILKNYYIKSAYNCCCGDGYKNNFVALCSLEKCIGIGCRFLDFEIYSYNNEPIVAASTANNNYIKETYNALELKQVLETVTDHAFDATKTNCANDPLILNFRIMSTNSLMLEKMGDLFEDILDVNSGTNDKVFKLLSNYNYATTNGSILDMSIGQLYKKIIIICDFNPSSGILDTDPNNLLTKLKKYINLLGKGNHCNIYRYNEIMSKGNNNAILIEETKRKFTIVLPDINNSNINYDPTIAYSNGCQAICMKHQHLDNNLLGYNQNFKDNNNYSFIIKKGELINVVPESLARPMGISIAEPS